MRIYALAPLLFLLACGTREPDDSAPRDVVVPDGAKKRVPQEVRDFLAGANTLELVSLFPYSRGYDEKLWDQRGYTTGEKIDDYAVLGATTLEPADRIRVLTEFYKGIAGNDDTVAACFNPRHALRARKGTAVVTAVICFECLQITFYKNGKRTGDALTTKDPRRLFNRVLKTAKVPLPDQ